MIIKDEGEEAMMLDGFLRPPPLLARPGDRFAPFLAQRTHYRDRTAHLTLRNHLIEHIWARFGSDFVGSNEDDSE